MDCGDRYNSTMKCQHNISKIWTADSIVLQTCFLTFDGFVLYRQWLFYSTGRNTSSINNPLYCLTWISVYLSGILTTNNIIQVLYKVDSVVFVINHNVLIPMSLRLYT